MAFGTYVQSKQGYTTATAAPSLAFTSNVTKGNLLIAGYIGGSTLLPTVSLPTDTLGNTWVQVGTHAGAVGTQVLYLFACLSCNASGANTVQFTVSGFGTGAQQMTVIAEYAGPATGSDGFAGISSGSATVTVSGPTTTQPADLLVQLAGQFGGGSSLSMGGGFTLRTSNSSVQVGLGDVNGVAPGAQSGSATWQAGGLNAVSGIGAFYQAPQQYSQPDCRNYGSFPNASRTVNSTKIYDVQTSSNSNVPGTDSRAAGAPTASGTYPQNSRTPGTYGPGE